MLLTGILRVSSCCRACAVVFRGLSSITRCFCSSARSVRSRDLCVPALQNGPRTLLFSKATSTCMPSLPPPTPPTPTPLPLTRLARSRTPPLLYPRCVDLSRQPPPPLPRASLFRALPFPCFAPRLPLSSLTFQALGLCPACRLCGIEAVTCWCSVCFAAMGECSVAAAALCSLRLGL